MENAVLVDAIRTPSGRGKPGGALSGIHPADLLAELLVTLRERNGLDSAQVDDVLVGCVSQVGDQSTNIARGAVLSAGFDVTVPATTIDRQCGSSQQAATFAAQGIMAGGYDIVIAAGVESMSRVPLGAAARGGSPAGSRLRSRFPDGLVNQGVSAELIAKKWGLSRDVLDRFAAESHRRAAAATETGAFAAEILPIMVAGPDGDRILDRDETVRASTTAEGLAALQPSFRTEEMERRFPDLEWAIHPGNSSPLTDGASAVLIMSESAAQRLGVRPRARFHSFAVVGDDPLYMLTGPIPATHRILERSGLAIGDIDAFEVNEAFASVPLAWAAEFDVDPSRLNPRGGAIALGHPLGASGTRLLTTMLHHLEATGGRFGLQTMCEGGGMANATIIERL
ncbi:thiolase family protein [Microbacterium jiangjiandongii]|uniref:thiolase family protein n=1 Tax=Microbacterium jiangjiandongii TaxID=3049071 RepID=UPI00214BEF53|nr:thiolase family protein [Microbacterium sp. zg.Y843]MCR2815368.1 thiolase family protein [Microbacterium sp. zg.Y843]